jgi:beta-phosphoglucomutase
MKNFNDFFKDKTHILWDFDGSFCDSEFVHLKAYERAFLEFGHHIKEEEYFHTFTHTGGGIIQEIKNYNLKCDPNKIKELKVKFYMESILAGKAKLFPDIPKIVSKLREVNIESAIASNSLKEEIQIILKQSGEKVDIKHIFGLEPGLRKKPFPDIFNHAIKTLNLHPNQVLIVEDSERGLIAAKNAQCQAIWIKTNISEKFSSDVPYIDKITHSDFLQIIESH